MLPEGFRPATRVTNTVTGTQVRADGRPVPHAPPATFDLTIDPNGEVRYVDNAKVDGLGYVDYRVTWLTREPLSPSGKNASRICTGHAVHNMAFLRHLALNLSVWYAETVPAPCTKELGLHPVGAFHRLTVSPAGSVRCASGPRGNPW